MRLISRFYAGETDNYSLKFDDEGHAAVHRYTPTGNEIVASGDRDDLIEFYVDLLRGERLQPVLSFDEAQEGQICCGCEQCACDDCFDLQLEVLRSEIDDVEPEHQPCVFTGDES